MLLDHLDGILNYCRTKVPLGIVKAENGNIKSLLRCGQDYRDRALVTATSGWVSAMIHGLEG